MIPWGVWGSELPQAGSRMGPRRGFAAASRQSFRSCGWEGGRPTGPSARVGGHDYQLGSLWVRQRTPRKESRVRVRREGRPRIAPQSALRGPCFREAAGGTPTPRRGPDKQSRSGVLNYLSFLVLGVTPFERCNAKPKMTKNSKTAKRGPDKK